MSSHTFPGRNPFGGTTLNTLGGNPMGNVPEDEEMATSPTASSFSPGSLAQAAGSEGGPSSFAPGPGSAFAPPEQGFPTNYGFGRRTSVSAESMDPSKQEGESATWKPPVHSKTDEQKSRIREAVKSNFLFSHLAAEQAEQVLDALFEKPIPAKGIKVISQGDVGDNFYIVETGSFDVHIHSSGSVQPGADGMGDKVGSIGPGGSFGELALMYNAPRAATIVSTENSSLLWALDRVTFKRILMDAALQRRRMYEGFLEQVDLFKGLKAYERSKIADALETTSYSDGEIIIRQADVGDRFFLLEEGSAKVYKKDDDDASDALGKEIMAYKQGDYFGELALLDNKPRAASIVASGAAKCAWLDKEGFRRLLGPVEDRMREQDPSKK